MSPEAIDRRLREVSRLWDLWNILKGAKFIGPVEPQRRKRKISKKRRTSGASARRGLRRTRG
jgi:hypothetical protein